MSRPGLAAALTQQVDRSRLVQVMHVLCTQGPRCWRPAWPLTWCLQSDCPSCRRRSASWARAHLSLQRLRTPSASIRYRPGVTFLSCHARPAHATGSFCEAGSVLAWTQPASDQQQQHMSLPSPDREVVCSLPFSLPGNGTMPFTLPLCC